MVHVVNKGKEGEREAIKFLQPTINEAYAHFGMEPPQLLRNQMQSAVGGYDIVGLDWIALEIKRCEQLSINAWWKQVTTAAQDGQVPVIMFRQNRKKWRFIMPLWAHTGGTGHEPYRAEISPEAFLDWLSKRLQYEIKKESENTEC